MREVNRVVSALRPRLLAWKSYATAFVGAAFLTLATAVWLAETSRYVMEVRLDFGEAGRVDKSLIYGVVEQWLESHPVDGRDCYNEWSWSAEGHLVCLVSARSVDHWFDAWVELKQRLQDAGVHPRSWTLTNLTSLSDVPSWSVSTLVIIYFLLTGWMIRGISLTVDLRVALSALCKNPWIPFTPLLVWFLVANISMLALTALVGEPLLHSFGMTEVPDEYVMARIMENTLAEMVTPWAILYLVILAPLFEESLFRGWLYEKTRTKLPVWFNALANAWFFMLLHVVVLVPAMIVGFSINPVQASPMLIPVSFALGLLFFYIRFRFDSLMLCIGLHSFHNATMLVGLGYLQANWHQWPA